MIVDNTGSIFDTDAYVLGHGVNCQGLMGGLAGAFATAFPAMAEKYKEECAAGRLAPGEVFFWEEDNPDYVVANIASQEFPGADASIPHLTSALRHTFSMMRFHGDYTIALPRIGCGIGGLDWEEVRPKIEKLSDIFEITVEVWTP